MKMDSTQKPRHGQIALILGQTVIITLLTIAVIVFGRQTYEARKQAGIAYAGELALQAEDLLNNPSSYYLQSSLLLGIESFRSWDTFQSRGALLDAFYTNPRLRQFLLSTGGVTSVAFSPDGKILASGSDDHSIILWDVTTGQPIGQPLKGHSDEVMSVAFSPDGKTLASGSADHTIILWDVATHQPIGTPLMGHTDIVSTVAFSPDGKTLASNGGSDFTIILWDVATHQPIGQPLMGHTNAVVSVAYSPDGKILASGSWDNTVILWDVATRQPIGQPLTHFTDGTKGVNSVSFSPDGKILAELHPKKWTLS